MISPSLSDSLKAVIKFQNNDEAREGEDQFSFKAQISRKVRQRIVLSSSSFLHSTSRFNSSLTPDVGSSSTTSYSSGSMKRNYARQLSGVNSVAAKFLKLKGYQERFRPQLIFCNSEAEQTYFNLLRFKVLGTFHLPILIMA